MLRMHQFIEFNIHYLQYFISLSPSAYHPGSGTATSFVPRETPSSVKVRYFQP